MDLGFSSPREGTPLISVEPVAQSAIPLFQFFSILIEFGCISVFPIKKSLIHWCYGPVFQIL